MKRNSTGAGIRTIGLLEHMGTGNLGDDATVDAAIQQIRRRLPDAVLIGLSLDPIDTELRHGIPSYPIRRGFRFYPELNRPQTAIAASRNRLKATVHSYRSLFLALRAIHRIFLAINTYAIRPPIHAVLELHFIIQSFTVAKSLDLLVICGGGQLLDAWGGPWQFPYTLLKWVLLARLADVPCYFVNVGAGPLKHPLSRWFVIRALRCADYVSFRDEKSLALIRSIGFDGLSQVVADNVYSLSIPAAPSPSRIEQKKFTVGVSPMAYCDPRLYWDKDQSVYDKYICTLAQFCAWLIRGHIRVRLFTTDIWFDTRAIADLTAATKDELGTDPSPWLIVDPIDGIDDLFHQMRSMDCVITSKFHGVIFAHLLNKPILALSHHPKVETLMNDMGLSDYLVDIRGFDLDGLIERYSALAANLSPIAARMPQIASVYRNRITAQFDDLFSLTSQVSIPA